MRTVFVRRDQDGNVIGYKARINPQTETEFLEQLPSDHPDVIAFENKPTPDPRPTRQPVTGNSIPEIRNDIDAIWQVLEDAGIVKP